MCNKMKFWWVDVYAQDHKQSQEDDGVGGEVVLCLS